MVFMCSCTRNPKERGWEIFPDMVHAVPYESFSENPVTPDGKTLLAAPPGTIARGKLDPLKSALSADNKTETVPQNVNWARAKYVFEHQCLMCHGPEGKGDGPLIPKFPNPPSFTSKRVRDLTLDEIYAAITSGVGQMPPHALQILPHDRILVTKYVKTLSGTSSEPAPSTGKEAP
jgi:mono/diheme cytochrome c family protein